MFGWGRAFLLFFLLCFFPSLSLSLDAACRFVFLLAFFAFLALRLRLRRSSLSEDNEEISLSSFGAVGSSFTRSYTAPDGWPGCVVLAFAACKEPAGGAHQQ